MGRRSRPGVTFLRGGTRKRLPGRSCMVSLLGDRRCIDINTRLAILVCLLCWGEEVSFNFVHYFVDVCRGFCCCNGRHVPETGHALTQRGEQAAMLTARCCSGTWHLFLGLLAFAHIRVLCP